ncbi:hypothetical protein BDB00DRAFT_814276 [Zychaea mexicana]|uniref:uncharacterized protein n=1 Tax=Zychaea mexicana TaxID=64656 RepID=UPI0022FE1749|nr:uncharacterized protein BDB00DRAFT_814276 [Zychaea mexicana]KAI9495347.1 hypothetical protein BDB00DRAFT_814276 [Zychaea mexicana]
MLISSFTIDLDEPCFTLSDKPVAISGILRARCAENLSCVHSQLEMFGCAHVGSMRRSGAKNTSEHDDDDNDDDAVVFKDQHTVGKWAYEDDEDSYVAPFTFHIPGSLPPSLSVVNKTVSIEYSITATLPTYGIRTTRSVQLFRSCDYRQLQQPSTRVYWGTTRSKRWRYEVEIPRIIPIFNHHQQQQEFVLSIRLRSSFEALNRSKVKSCLLTCQLLESVETKHHPKGWTEPRMISTRVLMSPAQTWIRPCRLPITFPSEHAYQPRPSVTTELIKIRHTLCVTLAFNGGVQGHEDSDKLQFEFPVNLVHTLDSNPTLCRQQLTTRSSSSSSAFYYYTDSSSDDCESRDSGVYLTC